MDDAEGNRHVRDMIKYNEFHKGSQKEDRTTAEIVEIAAALEDDAFISCVTWLWTKCDFLSLSIIDHMISLGMLC